MDHPPRVLRLTSVFEPPAAVLAGRGVRFDPIGGMQNHTACLTRALDARGLVQDVVTTRPPGARPSEALGERATVHRVGLPVRPMRQLWALPAARLAHRLAREATLIHAHVGEDLAVVPIALAAARRHRLPVVLTIHLSLAHTLARDTPRDVGMAVVGGRLEQLGARRADAVIALTPRLAELLLDEGVAARGLHVIPSGVVPRDYAPPLIDPLAPIARPRVLFVGRLARQKGVRTLIEAAALLRTPDAQLVLVGDGPERGEVERLMERHGLGDRVRLLGFRAHDEVPALLQSADVQVLPSHYEELGSALLEGLQAGLPIVASDTGGIPQALGEAGVLVPPRDPAALAAALDGLLADAAERARLGALAAERARDFDWDVLAGRVLDVYGQALGRRSGARAVEAGPGDLDELSSTLS